MTLFAGRVLYIEADETFNTTQHPKRRLGLIFNDNQVLAFDDSFLAYSKQEMRNMAEEARSQDERIRLTAAHFEIAFNCLANEAQHWFEGKLPRLQADIE